MILVLMIKRFRKMLKKKKNSQPDLFFWACIIKSHQDNTFVGVKTPRVQMEIFYFWGHQEGCSLHFINEYSVP